MKVYNPDHNEALKPGLARLLENFRKKRGFDAGIYADAKATLINQYFRNTPLKTAIVALSGGIDSSVVVGLVNHAKNQPESPIENIVAVTIPAYVDSATGQDDAAARAFDVMDSLGLPRRIIDISKAHKALTETVEGAFGIEGDNWARGQSVAHVRTMSLAYVASLMQMSRQSGILIGTTNRDEGAYLGYVGKYSDGLVDLQAISDLHKSEVWALARYLNLPDSTINAIPKGDMYDARPDTAVFGASYDFVELYLNYLALPEDEQKMARAGFTPDENAQFESMAANLERLHGYNAHKYVGNQAGSPAYHLNVLPSAVTGGWHSGSFEPSFPLPPNPEKIFNGYFTLTRDFLKSALANTQAQDIAVESRPITAPDDVQRKNVTILRPLISPQEADALIEQTRRIGWEPAGLDGYKLKNPDDPVGSWRATAYSPEYAKILWDRIAGNIPMIRIIPDGTDLDAHNADAGARIWRAVGINPALRFIRYDATADNKLFAHYDAPPVGRNTPKTLDSLVIYLTEGEPGKGGETAFITDPQRHAPVMERNQEDWTRVAYPDEIITAVTPEKGAALIFNHRVLHTSQPLDPRAKDKIIVRSDIVWQPVVTP